MRRAGVSDVMLGRVNSHGDMLKVVLLRLGKDLGETKTVRKISTTKTWHDSQKRSHLDPAQ
jgi:hypothetical protein